MSNDFDEMFKIFKKSNHLGARFFVARRQDGGADWKRFERDPIVGWFYDSAALEWIATGGSDAENNLSVSGNEIADTNDLGAKLSKDEQRRLVDSWEYAAQQYDNEHGVNGFVSFVRNEA